MESKYNIYSGNYPIKLSPNRVWRTYKGGSLLSLWKGSPQTVDDHFPEEWIASLVSARNPGHGHIKNEGLSELETAPGRRILLKKVIEAAPRLLLGDKHVAGFGCNPGLLVKALDSCERLAIQVHPDKNTARRVFGSDFGKTEAWYIIGGREISGEPPYILLGFKPGITREKWESMFHSQDIPGMIDSMNKFHVKPGQSFLIEGGVPHAIGPGCFIIEVQEPTDYTIRVEKVTPGGLEIPEFLLHQGIGYEKMFECFKYEGFPPEKAWELWCKNAAETEEADSDIETRLISYRDTKCFKMSLIETNTKRRLENPDTFSIIAVIRGKGILEWDKGKIEIKQGDELFLPAGMKNLLCVNTANDSRFTMVRCYPPVLET